MFPIPALSTAKIVVLVVLALFIAGLAFGLNHYHSKWVEVTAALAKKELELQTMSAAAQKCSDNTRKLADESAKKQKEIQDAQKEAEVLARKNKDLGNKLLSLTTSNPDKCAAAVGLIADYKSGALNSGAK